MKADDRESPEAGRRKAKTNDLFFGMSLAKFGADCASLLIWRPWKSKAPMVKFSKLQQPDILKEVESKSFWVEALDDKGAIILDARDWYRRSCIFIKNALERAHRDEEFPISEGKALVEEVVNTRLLGDLPEELLIRTLHKSDAVSFLISHPVNVTVQAILLGCTLGLAWQGLLKLGLCALLHDIGKIRVPIEILNKKGALSEKELLEVRRYPYESYKILSALGNQYAYLAETALHVSERLDGSGYPQGLKGLEIVSYAQIIGLVDIYEAMTHPRPHRPKHTHFHAVKEIVTSHKRAFAREILKAFLSTFSIFPIHSYVKLNSGAVGRVIEIYEDHPLRPKIRIVSDAQGREPPMPRLIDLRRQPILCIKEAVWEEGLPQ
jgi:HD-GYP domain-containing protein (c-di-GMP phosphodiesterase class II)